MRFGCHHGGRSAQAQAPRRQHHHRPPRPRRMTAASCPSSASSSEPQLPQRPPPLSASCRLVLAVAVSSFPQAVLFRTSKCDSRQLWQVIVLMQLGRLATETLHPASSAHVQYRNREESRQGYCNRSLLGCLTLLAGGARHDVIEGVPQDLGTLNHRRQVRPAKAHHICEGRHQHDTKSPEILCAVEDGTDLEAKFACFQGAKQVLTSRRALLLL